MRRARDRARRAAQTAEERDARLRQIRDNRRQSLATETEEERAARLQQMSANQHHRLAAETGSEREARLQRNREGQRGQQSQLPLFEQPSVQAKMRKFHAEIAALEMQKYTTCSERFPGLQLRSHSTARTCASIAFELTLAPTMLCIHLVDNVLSVLHYTYFIDVTCVKLDKFRICGTTYDTYTKVPLASLEGGLLTLAPIK